MSIGLRDDHWCQRKISISGWIEGGRYIILHFWRRRNGEGKTVAEVPTSGCMISFNLFSFPCLHPPVCLVTQSWLLPGLYLLALDSMRGRQIVTDLLTLVHRTFYLVCCPHFLRSSGVLWENLLTLLCCLPLQAPAGLLFLYSSLLNHLSFFHLFSIFTYCGHGK